MTQTSARSPGLATVLARAPAGFTFRHTEPRLGRFGSLVAALARRPPTFSTGSSGGGGTVAARVAVVLGIGFGIAALVVRLRYQTSTWLPVVLPPGWTSLAAVLVLVVVAHLAYAVLRPLSWLVPVLVALNAVSVVLDLPHHLPTAGSGAVGPVVTATALQAVLVAAMAVLLGKVVLLHRFAGRAYPLGPVRELPTLLPSQQMDYDELTDRLQRDDSPLDEHVIPVDGRRGDGKSFLLHYMQRTWAKDRDKPAFVIVDVWQQQTEVDLQVAIIEAVLSRPQTLRGLRWLRVPAAFLFARTVAHLRNSATVIRVKLRARAGSAGSGVETDLRLPRLNWQTLFERITSGTHTVVVLDEIDRATPDVAQAAMTMARRSVDIPGVTVVLPYIPELVRYKVFNPGITTLPDLASSMDAVLFEWTKNPEALGPAWTAARAAAAPNAQPGSAGQPPVAAAADRDHLHVLLAEAYLRTDADLRRALQATFEEKYLGTRGVRLRRLTAADVIALLYKPDLRSYVERLLGEGPISEQSRATIEKAITAGLGKRLKNVGTPPLRVLISRLHALLDVAARKAQPVHPAVVAVLTVVAFEHAAMLYEIPAEPQ